MDEPSKACFTACSIISQNWSYENSASLKSMPRLMSLEISSMVYTGFMSAITTRQAMVSLSYFLFSGAGMYFNLT